MVQAIGYTSLKLRVEATAAKDLGVIDYGGLFEAIGLDKSFGW